MPRDDRAEYGHSHNEWLSFSCAASSLTNSCAASSHTISCTASSHTVSCRGPLGAPGARPEAGPLWLPLANRARPLRPALRRAAGRGAHAARTDAVEGLRAHIPQRRHHLLRAPFRCARGRPLRALRGAFRGTDRVVQHTVILRAPDTFPLHVATLQPHLLHPSSLQL